MHRIFAMIVVFLGSTLPVVAQSPIPERRVVVTQDVDFYGSDLQALFDTTLGACQTACVADSRCQAFTFNRRSNACFPKSTVSDRKPYDGAVSAEVYAADPGALAIASARAADLEFLGEDGLTRARDQAEGIGVLHPAGPWQLSTMLQAATDRRAEGNILAALRWTGAALSKSDASDQWLEYARLSLMQAASNSKEQRQYRARGLSAAVNAYLRAVRNPERVSALMVLSEGLEQVERGQDMVRALRLASEIQPRDDVQTALDAAIAKYGFRITEHSVDSDTTNPRICAEFSEPLVKSGVNYAPYLGLPDQTLDVQAEGRQICIDGVKHGERYRVTFRAGLPAASGETLAKNVDLTLYVRDRAPSVVFPGRAYVLPKSAEAALPVETVNLDTIDLTLRRISDRNLIRTIQEGYFGGPLHYYELREFDADVAEVVWSGKGEVQNTLNRDIMTRLPLGDVLANQPAGIYALSASVPGEDVYDDPGATQWFVLSDLGLSTLGGTDGLHVFVRGLGDAAAKEGVKITLLSRANRVLGTAMSDARGYVHFEAGLTRGNGSAAPALVTAEAGADDFAFLSLSDPAFDLSDRGVEGREPAPPIDMFLATDRGAYRTGETIHATALVRDGVAAAISGLPITAILYRPDGVEYSRQLSNDDVAGGHVLHLPIGSTAPRGTWRLDIKADPEAPALVSRKLLVEDFLPERIDFTMTLPEIPIRPSDTPPLTVQADYLFGAPGADLKVEGEVTLRAADGLANYPGYRFGRYDERFNPRTGYLDGAQTDETGQATLALNMPEIDANVQPLEANIVLRVAEGSGRPVERQQTRALAPEAAMIGIKPLFEDVVNEGTEAAFQVIALGPDLKPLPLKVRWTLNRIETRYQWYQEYGSWNWEPIITRERAASEEATLGMEPLNVAAPVEWGHYELVVEGIEGDYIAGSSDFWAGWYAPADTSSTPDTLELSLDRPGYRSGETAQLRIVPRYAGKALISVMSNRLISMQAVDVKEGENLIPIPVTDEWGAGAYVTASVIRPMDVAAGQNPARALGLSYAAVDPQNKKLTVSVETAAESEPRGPLNATVRVAGVAEGETAYVTVAAVDVGILNLTGFKSPDPSAHYFGQRRLGMEIRDVYGRLIDGMNGAMGRLRSGGDAASGLQTDAPPPTEELVAYFSGPLTIGEDGRAEVHFDMPEFNGTVRLMAVAWSPRAVGQAEADVLVRDPVVVTASLPRFLAPGDKSQMLLEITHADGPAGRMGLDVTASGVELDAAAMPSGVTLAEKGKAQFRLPLTAQEVGDHAITIALTTPDGRQLIKTLPLGVRANDPEISTTRRVELAGGDTFTLDNNLFAGLRPGTGSVILSAGPLARFDAPGLLSALDRYPYGCTEQLASQAMPLLYLDQVATALGLGERDKIQERVDQAIKRVLSRQDSNGAFGVWRAGSGNFWLDAYVSDFLSRARAEGYAVPDNAFRTAMDNLRNRINYAPDFDNGGGDIAYALMVLAREGAVAMGDLRYYADVKAEAFDTPMAAAQLGAALASYGDQTRADAMFLRASRLMAARSGFEAPVWRDDYGTDLRDAAGLLSLAVESGSTAIDREALLARVAGGQRNLSTQESAWSLMAAKALISDPAVSALSHNGAPVEGPFVKVVKDDAALQPMALRNEGASATDITLTTFGIPEVPAEQGGYGYRIERAYYTMDGEPFAGPARTGERYVTVLTITPFEKSEARLIVNDPLPAGYEIDNPNLLRSGDISTLDWLQSVEVEHSEFRADRFIAAVNWRSGEPFQLSYIVRAISPGQYHHPAALVEDMYRPQYRAYTGADRLIVTQ